MNTDLRLHIDRQGPRQTPLAADADSPAAKPLTDGQARL